MGVEMYEENDIYEYPFSFTQEDVNLFAKISGDDNPIHLNEEYAKKTIFKRRIIHGFLSGSVFSKVFGTLYPGKGTIYLEQTMRYNKPMYTGEDYIASFKLLSINRTKGRAEVETIIFNSKKEPVLEGIALIQNKVLC
jgi:acyl dehydratase